MVPRTLLVLASLMSIAGAQVSTDQRPREPLSVEAEVRQNVLRQPIGDLTLDVLALPDEFIRRIVDRVIRISYQERYHMVVRDGQDADPADAKPNTVHDSTPSIRPPRSTIAVLRPELSDDVRAFRHAMPLTRPYLRGFRAPILERKTERELPNFPGRDASGMMRRAARFVASRLAIDGLLPTLVGVVETIGPKHFPRDGREATKVLHRCGFPVDLLGCFRRRVAADGATVGALDWILRGLANGRTLNGLKEEIDAFEFRWTPSTPGFQVATESGEHDVGLLRLQLTRGTYWQGAGAGGNLDVARQLIEKFPSAQFALSIEEKHLDAFLKLARDWRTGAAGRTTLFPSVLPVSQWARDNGMVGLLGRTRELVTLVPRYASRRDDGSMFIPNESFVMDGFAAAGHTVVQSALLFQGGNLIPVVFPRDGTRLLLIGEAEVYRNVALGLTKEQVREAFREEFGVDRVAMLPAVSFHIDFELTVRARGGALVAYVNDSRSAVLVVLECGLDALADGRVLNAAAKRSAEQSLREGRVIEFVKAVGGAMRRRMTADGHYPLSLARMFERGGADSGVGNLQRFLVAMDLLASWNISQTQMPGERHARAYVQSIRRREVDRAALADRLVELGFKVVGIPSLAEAERGVNYLNGIHERSRYLMPAYGGLFAPLDAAAEGAFRDAFGSDVRIVRIASGESQRRGGAVHCTTGVYPQVSE